MSSKENRYTLSRRCSRAGLTQKVTVCAACVATSSAVKSFEEQLRCRTLWTASCPYVHSELHATFFPTFLTTINTKQLEFPSQVHQPTCFWKWLPKVRQGPCLGFSKNHCEKHWWWNASQVAAAAARCWWEAPDRPELTRLSIWEYMQGLFFTNSNGQSWS